MCVISIDEKDIQPYHERKPSKATIVDRHEGKTEKGGVEPQRKSDKYGVSLELLERIRPELNLEKWPAIWRPAKSNRPPVVRTLKRSTSTPAGNRISAEVEIGFTNQGGLTTEDQKTYYGLIKQWEDGGRTPQQTFFSIRGLSRILRKRWGTNVIDAITKSLKRLRTTPFTWTDSYENGENGETIRKIEMLNILSELKIVQRERDGIVNHAVGYFKFNDFILNNLLARHTKPVLLDVIFQFQSEIAQLLYSHIDLILAGRDHYERRSLELFDDLGLKGEEYRKPSQRKKKLDRALAELKNVPLSKGGIVDVAEIEKTKDRTDYKVVFHRKTISSRQNTGTMEPQEQPLYAAPRKSTATVEAEELVARFHKLFHNVGVMHPPSKEVGQAVSLIATHGLEHAKYVVNFSHRAAAQTNYSPQTFGGILQYTSRALADYERHQRDIQVATRAREVAKEQHMRELQQMEQESKRKHEAEVRLAALPEAERQVLFMKTKEALLAQSAFLRGLRPESEALKATIYRAMYADLLRDQKINEGEGSDNGVGGRAAVA